MHNGNEESYNMARKNGDISLIPLVNIVEKNAIRMRRKCIGNDYYMNDYEIN